MKMIIISLKLLELLILIEESCDYFVVAICIILTGEFETEVAKKLELFISEYFYPTWFSNGEDGDSVSKFRRWEWNHFENDGPRTNNHNEAYNGKLDKLINKSNPCIWEFVNKIKSEETHYRLTYLRLKNPSLAEKRGFALRKRKSDDINKDLELANLKARYLKKEFDAVEFNRRFAYLCHEYGEHKTFQT